MNPPWIRRAALAGGGLLLLLVVVAGVLVASFDADRYKGLAIDWMKNERQRILAIDGPVELSLFPRLAVKLSKVRLSEAERARGTEFASIEEASLALQMWPLLRKQLVIDRIRAKGVRAAFSRDARGVRNIDDLMARGGGSGPDAAASEPGSTPLRLDISAVQLEDVQLRVRDEIANLAGDIALQSFSAGRLAHLAESPLALRASVDLKQPQALKLRLDGRATLKLDLDNGAATLGDLKLDLQGDVAGVKEATMNIAAARLIADPGRQQFEFDALKLGLAGKQGAQAFELAIDWPQLAVTAQQLKGSALSGRYKLSGPTAFAGNFRSAPPSGNFDAVRLPGLTLDLAGHAGPRKIDGNLKTALLLQPGRGAVAFERLDAAATVAEAGASPLQLALRGHAGAHAKGAQWTVDGALGGNRFESQGSAAFTGAVPHVKASARFDSLDLNKLAGPAAKAAPPGAAAPADTPVVLDGLRALNGQFALAAGTLVFRQVKVADAKLDAALDNGSLRVARVAGRAWGGSIDGNGSADARSQRLALKLTASGVDVNALLKDVAGKDLLEGSGRVTADLTTTGATLGALRSNLAGNAALQLRDGAVKGINLARSMRQARAALTLKQDALAKARETEKTDFSELNASARIANGVAVSDDLDVKSPYLRIGGAGRFDIGRGSIDYTARATVVAVPVGQDAGELAALRGVTVPVHLSGPFDAIDWRIQWSGVAAAALEGKVLDKLNEKLGAKLGTAAAPASAASAPAKPREQLKETLKGLFK